MVRRLNKKLWKWIVVFILVIAICVSITRLVYESYSIVEVRTLPVKVSVIDKVGLGLEEDVMVFGGVPAGSTSKREIVITNYHKNPLKVNINFNGATSRWIQVEEKEFILQSDEERRLDFLVYIPEGTKQGEYEGEVNVIFKRI